MTQQRFKPVLVTGFSFLLLGQNALAQDFIDVEAERRAAREAAGTPTATQSAPVTQRAPLTPSQARPEPAQEPTPSPVGGQGYSVPGIRPYSGQTVQATPTPSPEPRYAAPSGTGPAGTGITGTTAVGGDSNIGSLVVQVQQLSEEVRRLNGQVEEQAAEIRRLKEQSLERYVDIDRRLAEVTGAPLPNNATPSASDSSGLTFGGTGTGTASPAARTEPEAAPAQPGEDAAYQSAYDYVKARNFPAAVEAFTAFLGNYPFGRYAPNAHYWLGELYLVIEPADPELARQSFQLLLDQYPDNPKVPDALYKLGKVHFLKGNRDRSREYLSRVIKEHKGHPAAQLAQDFLTENF